MARFGIAILLAVFLGESASRVHAEPTPALPDVQWHQVGSPGAVGWSTEKLQEARKWSESLETAAVLIIHRGAVVDQWGDTALPLKCHSIRKSLLSALFGIYVDDGTIELDQTLEQLGIDDSEPSLTEDERQARLRDLLAARSGIYHPALYETAAMAAARPPRGSQSPNTFWYYNNWDFNASGSIFESLTGQSIFEAFERHLAEPLQMQDFDRGRHTSYVTGEDSVHRAYPFQLSARDLARVGLLFLREGRWGERQLIPADWVRESTASYSDCGESGGYGYMWWVAANGKHFPGVSLPDGSFSARGYRGHYLVVVPEWDLVVCHRVNTFRSGTSVSKSEFGKLLALIAAARPEVGGTQLAEEQLAGGNGGDATEVDPLAPAQADIEQTLVELLETTAAPGLSVALATDNQLRYAKGFGFADVEHQLPVTTQTKFRTASIAKSLTAAVVMSLAEQGQLDLDAEVQQCCPDFPRKCWPVTARQLLGHLGGVRHYKNRDESQTTKHFFDLSTALSTFADDPLVHEPGTKYLYSSFGYNLLGSIAEGAAERRFPELLKERVLERAGMVETVVDDQWIVIPDRSRGYQRATASLLERLPAGHNLQENEIYNAPLHDTSMKIPGGGLLSTPSDLVRFAIAMNNGRLLSEETRSEMWTPQKTRDGESTNYGLGWQIRTLQDRKVVSHTGGQAGTSTILMLVPETGTCVALMCNLQGVSLRKTAESIVKKILSPALADRQTAASPN